MKWKDQTYRDEHGMFRDAFGFQPFAKTSDGNASGLSDTGIGIMQPCLDNGPNLTHERCHEFATALHDNSQGKHGSTSILGLMRRKILGD